MNGWYFAVDKFRVTFKKSTTFLLASIVIFKPCLLKIEQRYKERNTILQAKKSCLFNSNQYWGKRTSANLFDVTMGSYDGAESCKLVGSFLLHHISEKHGKTFGFYRDDGLGVVKATPRETEMIKKNLCSIFNNFQFSTNMV